LNSTKPTQRQIKHYRKLGHRWSLCFAFGQHQPAHHHRAVCPVLDIAALSGHPNHHHARSDAAKDVAWAADALLAVGALPDSSLLRQSRDRRQARRGPVP
jgi:hypothetical protein